jgi:hypothetical protein
MGVPLRDRLETIRMVQRADLDDAERLRLARSRSMPTERARRFDVGWRGSHQLPSIP